MIKKIINILIISILLLSSGCQNDDSFYIVNNDNYDSNAFYQNDLKLLGADPSVIYISEGKDAGYYYMYITSDEIGVMGYLGYRSKDLVNWECVGTVLSSMKEYDEETGNTYISFGTEEYWAPEVIYDDEGKLYYMFYTANSYDKKPNEEYHFYGDIAVSENPDGPFVTYNKFFNKEPKLIDEKKKIYLYEPMFDFSNMDVDNPLYEKNNDGYMKVIDFSPFIDPVSKEKYVYFTRDLYPEERIIQSKIYGMKLNDDFSPDYSSICHLTTPNKTYIDDDIQNESLLEGKVNEGAFMIYHNNKYYLLYSACSYTLKAYSVRVAISDNPLGPFRKLDKDEGGFLLYAGNNDSWASGTGHCSVVKKDDKLFMVYHAHQSRILRSLNRAIAMDEIHFVKNNDGLDVPIVNGPSYALLPKTSDEYSNVISSGHITCDTCDDTSLLLDGVVLYHDLPFLKETHFEQGENIIKISFDDYVDIKSISIFNSYFKDLMIDKISNIKLHSKNKNINIGEIVFDFDKYLTKDDVVIPGGSFSIDIKNLEINEIEIKINADHEFNLSEIVILSK